MKFCAKCGKELMDEAVICPGCGEKCNEQGAPNSTPIQQGDMNIRVNKSANDKIDIKKTLLINIIPAFFLVIGLLLFIEGLDLGVSLPYLYSFDVEEYVGGDAYNYIIAACFKSGEIAAAEISKCINVSVGLLIACVSAFKLKIVKRK